MKALIILNLEDCTFDEIDEAEIKEINLVCQDKETGKEFEFEWETGFKIMPMPQRKDESRPMYGGSKDWIVGIRIDEGAVGWNDCIDEILGDIE